MRNPRRGVCSLAFLGIATLLLGPLTARAGEGGERVDLAAVDALSEAGLRGDRVSLLGLHLGMTWDEAKAAVAAHPDMSYQADSNPGRFYVNDTSITDGDPALFYCQWPDSRTDMGRMVIYPRATRFVPEGTRKLLAAPSLAEMPADVKAWLGEPTRSVVTLDIPAIGLKLTTHVFEERSIEVIDYVSSGEPGHVSLAIMVPELLTPAK